MKTNIFGRSLIVEVPFVHAIFSLLKVAVPSLLLCLFLTSCARYTAVKPPEKQGAEKQRAIAHLLPNLSDIQTGDLLFLDLNCGDLCEAIETVTKSQFSVSSPNLSHVGVLAIEPIVANRTATRTSHNTSDIFVYEAWPEGGVKRTPLVEVLSRVDGGENQANGFYVGRFKKNLRPAALAALSNLRTGFLGKAYDDAFIMDNEKYYCSELIYETYRDPKTKNPIFKVSPMFFGVPPEKANQTWTRYFSDKKMKMPSGQPGISPLGIYLQGRENNFFK